MTQRDPPLGSVIAAIMRGALRDLAHFSWRPHRVFNASPEHVRDHHRRLADLYGRSGFSDARTLAAHAAQLVDQRIAASRRQPLPDIRDALVTLVADLQVENKLAFPFPALDDDLIGNAAYTMPLRRQLDEIEPLLVHESRIRATFDRVIGNLISIILEHQLPRAAFDRGETDVGHRPFTVPLLALLPDTPALVETVLSHIVTDTDNNAHVPDWRALAATRAQLLDNLRAASGLRDLADLTKNPHKVTMPRESDLAPADVATRYLARTPFVRVLDATVRYAIPDHLRPEHGLISAASGTGKTQLLQHDILSLLERHDPPGMVVIDSQGQMLRKIERLACFDPEIGRLKDRLVVIDPEDEASPALNMFVVPPRVQSYDRNIRETIEAGTLQLFNFIFAALSQELTGRQSTAFTFVTRLMLVIPGATLRTLRQLLEDNAKSLHRSPFAQHIATLDEDAQAFFKNQFFETGYAATKNQIVQRLYGVLRVPAFNRMFGSTENKLDLFQALQDGKVVLFNTSKALLGDDASSLFGRYAIALTIRAAFERVAAPEPYRLALLYIDEAKEYFRDATLDNLLTQVRKYNMGATIAFQNLDQLPAALRPVVLANTSIKLCAGLSDHDARLLARDMRTSPDMLLALKKTKHESEFACYLRNETPHAIRLTVPFLTLESAPRMSEAAYRRMRALNRDRIAATSVETSSSQLSTQVPPPNNTEPSTPASEW